MSVGETIGRDTKYDAIFAALAAPFRPEEIRVLKKGGRDLEYVTARAVANRLDEVIGPAFWWDEYTPGENSVMCRLTLELPDGRRVTKCDAGGYAGMADSGDDDMSGFSSALKRAAAKHGVARYLYHDGVPDYAREHFGEVAEPRPAQRPAHAPASQSRPAPTDGGHHAPHNGHGGQGGGQDRAPTNGRQLFAWTKKKEEEHEVGLLKYVNGWAKLQDFPGRMVDFTPEQVALAHKEMLRKLESVGSQDRGDSYEEALAN